VVDPMELLSYLDQPETNTSSNNAATITSSSTTNLINTSSSASASISNVNDDILALFES